MSCTTLFAEVPTVCVAAVPNPEILVCAMELTANVIVPDEVTGELPTVNSDAPLSATPIEVTVPVLDGVTCVYVMFVEPIEPVVSVVHKNILLSFVEP